MMGISFRNEEMNDHLSLWLQCCPAKRKLAELFQAEGFVQENQPPIVFGGVRINSCNGPSRDKKESDK
jgi:hypothetical protein